MKKKKKVNHIVIVQKLGKNCTCTWNNNKGEFLFQTMNNGNTTSSVLSFVASKTDTGKNLTCRASNPIMSNAPIIEDSWTLKVHCEYKKKKLFYHPPLNIFKKKKKRSRISFPYENIQHNDSFSRINIWKSINLKEKSHMRSIQDTSKY